LGSGGDRRAWPLVDLEPEDVRPGVVAHDVEVPLALGDERRVELGVQDLFRVEDRTGDELPEGVDDARPAAGHDRAGLVAQRVGGVLGKSARVENWLALRTKQRPSTATCRMVATNWSRPSAVGAQYSSIPLPYMAMRIKGM